ncbi:hypothetical protein ACWCYY_35145 [Kitasatospora sp. NPDC001664]
MPDTITPTETPATSSDTAPAPEVVLHPDFVVPELGPYATAAEKREAINAWYAAIATQARAAYPDEADWLRRACYPGPVPTVPLDQYDGPLRPDHLTDLLAELQRSRTATAAPQPDTDSADQTADEAAG